MTKQKTSEIGRFDNKLFPFRVNCKKNKNEATMFQNS